MVPLFFVAWTTSPFVSFIHLRLPPFARQSEAMLRSYFKKAPADIKLEIVTMSTIAKPRVSTVLLSELQPANQRLGIVNYVRDTAVENATRKWYNFRALGKFSIQKPSRARQPWLWDVIAEGITKRGS